MALLTPFLFCLSQLKPIETGHWLYNPAVNDWAIKGTLCLRMELLCYAYKCSISKTTIQQKNRAMIAHRPLHREYLRESEMSYCPTREKFY